MSEMELDRLEREVEEARQRVAVDLARLRAPGAMAALKVDVTAQAMRTKDRMLDSARDSARQRTNGLVDEVKARIAANPGAALAIAAGLAWRLYRHPPITTLLVGGGLVSLMRTDPSDPAVGAGAAARAAELAESASGKIEEWRESDVARDFRERVEEMVEGARERLGELTKEAGERIGAVAETAKEQVEVWRSPATARSGNGGSPAVLSQRQRPPGEMPFPARSRSSDEQRDQVLLGAAALAVGAAITLAASRSRTKRRSSRSAEG
jgi:ElaB/YqjD/DUF883 family membrane-anchored ribosome-binding protein